MSASTAARLARPLCRGVVPVLVAASACAPAAASAPDPGPTVMTPSAAASPSPAPADTGVIRVSGTARVDVASDRARLRFALETEAKSAAEDADAKADRRQAVLAAVRSAVGDAGAIGPSG
ncbi:MAG: SIMPL domain-containing protein [Longimicrobiales bacterium]